MIMRCTSDYANFALCRKRDYHVINFPICSFLFSFFGRRRHPFLSSLLLKCRVTAHHHILLVYDSAVSWWQAFKVSPVTRDIAMRPRCAYSLCVCSMMMWAGWEEIMPRVSLRPDTWTSADVHTYLTRRRRTAFTLTFDELVLPLQSQATVVSCIYFETVACFSQSILNLMLAARHI